MWVTSVAHGTNELLILYVYQLAPFPVFAIMAGMRGYSTGRGLMWVLGTILSATVGAGASGIDSDLRLQSGADEVKTFENKGISWEERIRIQSYLRRHSAVAVADSSVTRWLKVAAESMAKSNPGPADSNLSWEDVSVLIHLEPAYTLPLPLWHTDTFRLSLGVTLRESALMSAVETYHVVADYMELKLEMRF